MKNPKRIPPDSIRCKIARGRDIDRMLALRNQIFPPITRQQFASVEGLEACVALAGERALAALPLAVREVQLGPSETCQAAFLHAVGTHPDSRGLGVGSALIRAAMEQFRSRVDALMVYRTGGERTPGYSFYKKAGFHELMFATTFRLRRRRTPPADVTLTSGEAAILARQNAMRGVFTAAYGSYGGYWARGPQFYERALRSSYFLSRPHDFLLLESRTRGKLSAYILLGRPRSSTDLKILEMAALPGREHSIDALLAAAWRHAGQGEIILSTSAESPLYAGVLPWVKETSVRSPVLLGVMLDPAARAARLTGKSSTPSFSIWAPCGDYPVNTPGRAAPVLGLANDALHRLLFRRLSLRHALPNEAATVHSTKPRDAARLDAALPSRPWVYHALDYL